MHFYIQRRLFFELILSRFLEYGAAAAGIPPPFPITTTISPSSFYYPDQTPITNSTAGR
ncbi:unnamed protein product, partial [Rotaria sp. Silwood2]